LRLGESGLSARLLSERSSGVLLHLTSLPGPHASGDLGPAAYAFADWLALAKQAWWQMLPVGPAGAGNSPYDSPSSFAGSPWLVSLEEVLKLGLLRADELPARSGGREQRARFAESMRFRAERLRLAYERFANKRSKSLARALERLRAGNRAWLGDWALFCALRRAHGGARWTDWDPALRDRERGALSRARRTLADEIAYHEFVQLMFELQWQRLRDHCQARGIALLGDVPMFVAHDSADVWANRDLFFLDSRGERSVVAGVPPDAFSKTGQLWGNPLYRWARLRRSNFEWWVERLQSTLARFDAVRLDHFIGFRHYWEVPAHARTAKNGRYVRVPGEALLTRLEQRLGRLPFVAEDLGNVTPDVIALRDRFELPGMRVLSFAFGPGGSDYLPHRYSRRSVVYTGTHDNDTITGWFASLGRRGPAGQAERRRVLDYVGTSGREIHWDLMRVASMSVADVALFPMQDVLGLGSAARMNLPGTTVRNWVWRMLAEQPSKAVAERLGALTESFERGRKRP
jgi:4-alpha-glucanotransferase